LIREILPEEIIEYLEKYSDKLNDIIKNFNQAIKLLNDLRVGEARSKLSETMKIQKDADNIRKNLFTLLEEARMDAAFKEDFLHLVKRLDRITDWIKEASRELTILPYLEIPDDIRKGLEKMINKIVEAAEETIEALKNTIDGKYDEAKKLISHVEALEEEADELDVENRGKLLKYHDQFKPYTMAILIHDLNHDLEEAADACREAADYLRVIIMSWIRR